MIHWRILGFTIKLYHGYDTIKNDPKAQEQARVGRERYIKKLEMSLDRKNEEIARLKPRATFTIGYLPNVSATATDVPSFRCEVCEKPVMNLLTLDPDYPNEQAYCQGH